MASRLAIRVIGTCSNHCLFCAQEGLDRPVGPFGVEALAAPVADRAPDADELTFVGGEPTLLPDLESLVAEARRLGFRRVGLQTNGNPAGAPGRFAALAKAGLTDVHFSIHGVTAALHDYHTGVPGSFTTLLAAAGSAAAAGLDLVVSTVVTRSNLRNLHELPRFLVGLRVRGWCLFAPRVAGRAGRYVERLVPRPGMAAPFVVHALDVATKAGLPAWASGWPACMLGPMAVRTLPEPEPRAFGERCDACAARPACGGVDGRLLQRFGDRDLVPRAPFTPAREPSTYARMFVGVGPLAPAAAAESLMPAPESEGLVRLGARAGAES